MYQEERDGRCMVSMMQVSEECGIDDFTVNVQSIFHLYGNTDTFADIQGATATVKFYGVNCLSFSSG